MSHTVMPFDMAKTIHVFKMTESGGVDQVVTRNARYADQIPLIRRHLKREAAKFQRGDYSDPAELHGSDMPGLETLGRHRPRSAGLKHDGAWPPHQRGRSAARCRC